MRNSIRIKADVSCDPDLHADVAQRMCSRFLICRVLVRIQPSAPAGVVAGDSLSFSIRRDPARDGRANWGMGSPLIAL